MTRKERYEAVISWFEEHMPVAETELHYESPFELLVAVILSAQCTDKRVNLITPRLFKQYPTAEVMARAEVEDIFELIRSVSYPNAKAKYLVATSKLLVEHFCGEVPESREELMKLPGVGRKTANVIASVIYGRPTMAVDTHVFRVANRIGLTTNSKTPLETELTLVRYIPESLIPKAHHWLILHGRYVCVARKPHCSECGLAPYCRYYAAQQRRSKKETK
ncbi:endonuclease III [Porphyromonas catoniae]|uniref:Endonuclease III n=1 Tax=Porphyromonas catoniae ATCC 51270 TaxID=887901 RepID=Z4WQR0_9PORP|nr:endonuclease III [Porphyromonas catoniae]EWC91608.1 endonuclease III [Porphyromonas catoniae ATCC 51270]